MDRSIFSNSKGLGYRIWTGPLKLGNKKTTVEEHKLLALLENPCSVGSEHL